MIYDFPAHFAVAIRLNYFAASLASVVYISIVGLPSTFVPVRAGTFDAFPRMDITPEPVNPITFCFTLKRDI
jgi:hypothetical protein